jgi:hypothetical protein
LRLIFLGFAGLFSFISECGLGGIRKSAPIRRFVPCNRSSLASVMVYIPPNADKLGLLSTYAFGLADPPNAVFSIPSITEIAGAFTTNLLRLKAMMTFPAYLADFASVIHRLQLKAHFEKFGDLDIDSRLNDLPTAQALFERFIALFHEHNATLQAARENPAHLSALANDMIEKGGAITVIIAGAPAAINSFELAMMSYITSAWTIFETATGDVWEAALNHRPHGLADLNGKKRYKKRDERRVGDEAVKLEKLVRLDTIRRYEWDTRNKMGSILRDKFAFTTLSGIRDAYESAFYKKANDIDKTILSDYFDQLSALRNVIVHKSAICDAEYMRRSKDISALPKFQIGEKIQLHGKMVANLVHYSTQTTFKLLFAVDQWLVENATKSDEGVR